jgi:hypothetical protein
MIEGPGAWERFRGATKEIVKVLKSALPPNPFGKRTATFPCLKSGGRQPLTTASDAPLPATLALPFLLS